MISKLVLTTKILEHLRAAKDANEMLIALKATERNTWLSTRNIKNVSMSSVTDLNAYVVLKYKRLLITKDALDALVASRSRKKK